LGQRIEYPTGDLDTPENREHWEEWLDDALDAIASGTFVYAVVFPNAKPEKKVLFARLESKSSNGKTPKKCPETVTFGEVINAFRKHMIPKYPSKNKQDTYESKLSSRIEPFFKDVTLAEINRLKVGEFISDMAGTEKKGE
jgi:hypothetical protein